MTIRELYAWAQEHDALDLPFYMTFTVDNDYGGFDFYKHEVVPEIGTIEDLDDGCITYYDTQEEFNSHFESFIKDYEHEVRARIDEAILRGRQPVNTWEEYLDESLDEAKEDFMKRHAVANSKIIICEYST